MWLNSKKMAEEFNEEPIVDIQEAYSKTEHFIEDNKKTIGTVVGVIFGVALLVIAYKYWFIAGKEKAAQKELFVAENYFEKDSLDKAIHGDGVSIGLEGIVRQYGLAPSGNLAHYYLGISYLKKGEFEKAIEQLKSFNAEDIMVAPIATGAIGDCYVELNKVEEGINYYLKAAKQSTNKFTSPIYLKKAGLAYENLNKFKEAVTIYERIKTDFPKSTEAQDIDKYIARAKTQGNLNG